jgi:glycosyltransferase involved in cell wall biosynthesis
VRVLYVTEVFLPHIGGVEVLSGQLLRALARRGHEFTVIACCGDDPAAVADSIDYHGIPVHRFRFRQSAQRGDVRTMADILGRLAALRRAFRPQLVHTSSWGSSSLLHGLAHPGAARTLVTLHETLDAPRAADSPATKLLATADWVVAISGAVLADLHRFLPETIARSSLILNALAMPARPPSPPPLDPPRLLAIGRLVPEKGFDVAIDAMPSVLARHPAARLVIAGDGSERAALERRAERLSVSQAVEFPGWVAPDDVPALIARSSMVVMPSRWREPFGLVALEAAQAGRPIVATSRGGLPEIVVSGETGLLVDGDDPRALADAVVSLLDRPGAAVRMGAAARERAERCFSWEAFVDAYDRLYRRLGDAAPGQA